MNGYHVTMVIVFLVTAWFLKKSYHQAFTLDEKVFENMKPQPLWGGGGVVGDNFDMTTELCITLFNWNYRFVHYRTKMFQTEIKKIKQITGFQGWKQIDDAKTDSRNQCRILSMGRKSFFHSSFCIYRLLFPCV